MRVSLLFSSILGILIIFIGMSLFLTAYAATNYAPNPSFEQSSSNLDNWMMRTSDTCGNELSNSNATFVWDHNNSLSGNNSLLLENITWNNDNNIPETWITEPQIYENGAYEIRVYVKEGQNNFNLSPAFKVCMFQENPYFPYMVFKIRAKKTNTALNNWVGYQMELPIYINNKDYLGRPVTVSIGIGAQCVENKPCSGSLWFDDITLNRVGALYAVKFQDTNGNGTKDSREWPIRLWNMTLFERPDCLGTPIKKDITTQNGEALFYAPVGVNSVLEETRPYYINITPLCQNVQVGDLQTSPEAKVTFANMPYRSPPFPYLSQKDPLWGSNEYDHGNTIGPFFCGTTIGGCGCAITSSAMLLKYHGATKSPTGEETNPATLNTWLKNNNGYAFGALKWNSVAAYSVKANQNFGTQKIRFVGTGGANNFAALDTDLANSKPAILEEPGHFIAAYQKQNSAYSIADPAYQNRTTLASYSNSFLSLRRFEKTSTDLSAIYISTPTPNDVLITDSQGRRAGRDSFGQTLTEIPNSFYFLEPELANQTQENPQSPPAGSGVNMLVILTPQQDAYNVTSSSSAPIDFSSYDRGGDIQVKEFSTNSATDFELDYSPEPGYQFKVLQKVDIEIQGVYPKKAGILPLVIKSDENLNIEDVDLSTLLFAQVPTDKDKANLVSTGTDGKKDLKVFFDAKSIDWTKDWCLTGQTIDQTEFKGCVP